jgi:tetratricopeptide (TPR) repeat protein
VTGQGTPGEVAGAFVPDNPRIEELRRRVQRDPASIAFAQLAEEYRRAGRFQEAVETCCAGLERHPGYLSARVTLGRSLVETGELDHAQAELEQVLHAAPENLAALRGLAEIHHRRGELREALGYYRSALDLARHDPDLEQVVREIGFELEPSRRSPEVPGGLTFEQAREELLSVATPAPTEPPVMAEAVPSVLPEPQEASSRDLVIAREQLALFERWLGSITEERQRRQIQS